MQNLIINQETKTSVDYTPVSIQINGLEDLKKMVTIASVKYKNLIVNEDDVKQAKKDKADLNKLIKAIDDKRKEVKKAINGPVKDFEATMKELIEIIEEPKTKIDMQIASYTEKAKEDKKQQIIQFINEVAPNYDLDPTYIRPYEEDPSLLNASTSKKKWQDVVMLIIERRSAEKKRIADDKRAVKKYADILGIAAEPYYYQLQNNSVSDVIEQMETDLNQRKAEQEAEKASRTNVGNKVIDNETGEVTGELKEKTYTIKATTKQLSTLTSFMYANGIEFREDD